MIVFWMLYTTTLSTMRFAPSENDMNFLIPYFRLPFVGSPTDTETIVESASS